MPILLNETHDPARRSFVESANLPGSDFPIQNLPFGVFRMTTSEQPRVGVAIGDQIVDVAAAAGLFGGAAAAAAQACGAPSLNPLMSSGPPAWSALRLALSRELAATTGASARLGPYLRPRTRRDENAGCIPQLH
jgi:fumarylacetoacetase